MDEQQKLASVMPEEGWGEEPEFVAPEQTLPYVDPVRREFHCSNGQVWKLSARRFNALIVMQIQAKGKPDVPKVEVTLLGKHKQLQDNPNDPAYKEALKAWQIETNSRVMQYIFCTSINTGEIPDDFVEEYLDFVPNAKPNEIKYAFIVDRTPEDDIAPLMDAISGETEATEGGMQTVAASFPSDGGR